jgi:hypothetical protein
MNVRSLFPGLGRMALVVGLTLPVMLPAAEPVSLFNGKNLDGWTFKGAREKSKWAVGVAKLDDRDPAKLVVRDLSDGVTAELINAEGGGVDLYTTQEFGDATITLEVMVPKGSNSGVYVLGEYEVQVLDSYGKEQATPGDLGGLYGTAAPKKNAAKKPGEWQTMEIVFEAPRFAGDKKVSPAKFVKVVLNGETIHENVEVKGPTRSGVTGREAPRGPLMLQGDHGPVAYRNLKIVAND